MEWIDELGRRLRQLFRRKQWEDDLAEEMRLHLDLRAADKGSEAIAKRKFGNAALLREQSRGVWGWTFWDALAQDVRYAILTHAWHWREHRYFQHRERRHATVSSGGRSASSGSAACRNRF